MKRAKARIIWRVSKKEISGEVLANQLRLTDVIKPGDVLMVHASLSAIGKVIDGSEAIIHALQEVLTEGGTLLMPAYHQPKPVINMIESGVLVDLRTSKSTVGVLTEEFRTSPGVLRSSHPFSSVCSWGHYSGDVTKDHDKSELICGPGSPLDGLYHLSGKIMGIGISIAWISIYHLLEDKWEEFPIEVHCKEVFKVKYIDSNGNEINRKLKVLDPLVSLTRIEVNEWVLNFMTKHMIEKGILHEFMFGQARSWVFDVQPFYEELKDLARQGITIYSVDEGKKSRNQLKR